MSRSVNPKDSALDAAEALRDDLREVIREARGVLKDLEAERRRVEAAIKSIPGRVEREIADSVAKGLRTYTETLQQATQDGVERVTRSIRRLEEMIAASLTQGGGPVPPALLPRRR